MSRIDWRAQARCAEVDGDLFFPVGNQHQIAAQNQAAKRICAGCSVRVRCLEWALNTGQNTGVWGGLSERERRRLVRVPDPSMTVCLNEQAWIEEQLAKGTAVKAIARELGVDSGVLTRAIERFEQERAALDAASKELAA